MLTTLAASFVVMAEPAPTDLAFVLCLLVALMGLRLPVHTLAYVYALSKLIFATSCVELFPCAHSIFITLHPLRVPVLIA